MSSSDDLPPRAVIAMGSLLAYPRVLLNPVLGVFKPLEAALLRELVARSEPAISSVVACQLPLINKVVRVTAKTSESNLYRATPWGVDNRRPEYLPDRAEESQVAAITFSVPNLANVTATFWAVYGKLFSIEFSADVREVLRCANPQILGFR